MEKRDRKILVLFQYLELSFISFLFVSLFPSFWGWGVGVGVGYFNCGNFA